MNVDETTTEQTSNTIERTRRPLGRLALHLHRRGRSLSDDDGDDEVEEQNSRRKYYPLLRLPDHLWLLVCFSSFSLLGMFAHRFQK